MSIVQIWIPLSTSTMTNNILSYSNTKQERWLWVHYNIYDCFGEMSDKSSTRNTLNRKSRALAMAVVFNYVRHTTVYFTDSKVIVRGNWIRKRQLNWILLCPFYEQQLMELMHLLSTLTSLPRKVLVWR